MQGEQVGVLWGWLLAQGIKIHFAHRTFAWSNEARGVAAVHCVIVGFGVGERRGKAIYEYEDIRGEPHAVSAANINPYLVDAPDVVLTRRSWPICDVPAIGIGNKPIDDGSYLFTQEEKVAFLKAEPDAQRFFRRWIGADEFINGYERWCLWLGNAAPAELRTLPEAMKRVQAVQRFRAASRSVSTRALAETPTRFHVENIPSGRFIVFPRHSGEARKFLPLGFGEQGVLVGDSCLVSQVASVYHFGVLTSTMHNAWLRYTCGRLESRYRYSAAIVYNNFPWPESATTAQKAAIEAAAQAVLDARAAFPGSTLADLYDPLTMPPALVKAHQKLDAAVDAAYQQGLPAKRSFKTDAERVAFLFELYQRYTSLLPADAAAKRPRRRAIKP